MKRVIRLVFRDEQGDLVTHCGTFSNTVFEGRTSSELQVAKYLFSRALASEQTQCVGFVVESGTTSSVKVQSQHLRKFTS